MLSLWRRLTMWSPPRCAPMAAVLSFSLSSSACLGVWGGLGVALREPHGDRALMPADRKPGLLSGVDMLPSGEAPPATRASQL